MYININDKPKEIPTEVTNVEQLLAWLNIRPEGTAVAVGGKLVTRRQWSAHTLQPMDNVMIISAAYGG